MPASLSSGGLALDPALGLLLPRRRLPGHGSPLARVRAPSGAQSVDDHCQVALAQLGGTDGVAELDPGEELQQELDIEKGDVFPDQAGTADSLEQLDGQ